MRVSVPDRAAAYSVAGGAEFFGDFRYAAALVDDGIAGDERAADGA